MSCNNCSTATTNDKTSANHKTTAKKSCSSESGCSRVGFEKMGTFNWLAGVEQPHARFPSVELRFKNGRKEFFNNPYFPHLQIGELVCVEVEFGQYDIGRVSLVGELVRMQMRKKEISLNKKLPKVIRKTTDKEFEAWKKWQEKEHEMIFKTRVTVAQLGLNMKISDIEFQADGHLAIFYYIADERVDFRELIKILAQQFGIRIVMRQIGARQESGKVGGIGSCGRELCCSTWLTDFRTVNTSAARYQQLSINPQKLTGQCGKLKCCLNYELDMYMEAFRDFPNAQERLYFAEGMAIFFKADIFKRLLWYTLESMESGKFLDLSVEDAKFIIDQNKKDIRPSVALFQEKDPAKTQESTTRVQSRGQILKNSIDRSQQEFERDKQSQQQAQKNRRPKRKPRRNINKNTDKP